MLKLDTQGNELRVLRGATRLLDAHVFKYVQYEFSPWLMKRGDLGDPKELLGLLPARGGLCFDMMGKHNDFPRPSRPLSAFFDSLDDGLHGHWRCPKGKPPGQCKCADGPCNTYGPFDDILCFFYEADEGSKSR